MFMRIRCANKSYSIQFKRYLQRAIQEMLCCHANVSFSKDLHEVPSSLDLSLFFTISYISYIIQGAINTISEWYSDNQVTINADKTDIVPFTS